MRLFRWSVLMSVATLSGCVLGYGRCLFVEPVKSELVGDVHFRVFRRDEGIDRVPILTMTHTAYVYAPAISMQCQSADEVQLETIADLPPDIAEGARVVVEGTLVTSTQEHQHTRFVFNVSTIRLLKRPSPSPAP